MPADSYLVSKDAAKTLHIEELVKHSAGLTIKLHAAETEIGRLSLAIEHLEDGNLALTVKLEDSNDEIGRLGMVLKQQEQHHD